MGTYDGSDHHTCFFFGNKDEQITHDDASLLCAGMNGILAEVPDGPNLNHWIVEKLLQKHDRMTSEGEPRRPIVDTQYWLGATNNFGENCLTYILYQDIFGFKDFKWNDWNGDTA